MCDHSKGLDQKVQDDVVWWECEACGQQFVTLEEYEHVKAGADMAASVASAMLWDFHVRAVEKYGDYVAAAVAPDEALDGYMYNPDEEHEHEFYGGTCTRCGASQFVGTE